MKNDILEQLKTNLVEALQNQSLSNKDLSDTIDNVFSATLNPPKPKYSTIDIKYDVYQHLPISEDVYSTVTTMPYKGTCVKSILNGVYLEGVLWRKVIRVKQTDEPIKVYYRPDTVLKDYDLSIAVAKTLHLRGLDNQIVLDYLPNVDKDIYLTINLKDNISIDTISKWLDEPVDTDTIRKSLDTLKSLDMVKVDYSSGESLYRTVK